MTSEFQIFYGLVSVKVPHDLLFKCEGLFGYFYPVLLLYVGCVVVNNIIIVQRFFKSKGATCGPYKNHYTLDFEPNALNGKFLVI